MSAYPNQQGQVGLAMWRAERAGRIQAPPERRGQVARSGWPAATIDAAFEALAGVEVQPIGGLLMITSDLDSYRTADLRNANLIQLSYPNWTLTAKGVDLWRLLCAYADPENRWR